MSNLLAHPLCGYGSDLDLHSSIEIFESNISLELSRHLVDACFRASLVLVAAGSTGNSDRANDVFADLDW